jgi:hypothetical protein
LNTKAKKGFSKNKYKTNPINKNAKLNLGETAFAECCCCCCDDG